MRGMSRHPAPHLDSVDAAVEFTVGEHAGHDALDEPIFLVAVHALQPAPRMRGAGRGKGKVVKPAEVTEASSRVMPLELACFVIVVLPSAIVPRIITR